MEKENFNLEMPKNHAGFIVPYSFFVDNFPLDWNEIYFGISSGFASMDYFVKKAEEEILVSKDVSTTIIEIASIFSNEMDQVEYYIPLLIEEKIIDENVLENSDIRDKCENKYIYIYLLWMYQLAIENEKNFSLFLEIISKLYSLIWDFKNFSDIIFDFESILNTFDVTEKNKSEFLVLWEQQLVKQKHYLLCKK